MSHHNLDGIIILYLSFDILPKFDNCHCIYMHYTTLYNYDTRHLLLLLKFIRWYFALRMLTISESYDILNCIFNNIKQ